MRARHTIIAFIGLGLAASLACSRNANQQNFIGQQCKAASDCPPELLCVNNACWEPCKPDGTCPNPGETCVLNACVPGGQNPGAGEEGGINPGGTDAADFPDGNQNQPPINSDGTAVVTGLKLSGPEISRLYTMADATNVYLLYQADDPLNGPTWKVVKSAQGGVWSPQDVATGVAETLLTVAGGKVYYTKGGGGTANLHSRPIDLGSGESASLATIRESGTMGASVAVDGDELMYVEGGTNAIKLLNLTTGVADPTNYGTGSGMPASVFVGKNGNSLAWINQQKGQSISSFFATKGNAGASTSVPLSDGINLERLYVSGTNLELFLMGSPSSLLYEAVPPSAPSAVSAWPNDDSIRGNLRFYGNAVYFVRAVTGGEHLAKFDFGTKQVVDSGKKTDGVKDLCVTASGIFVMENVPGVGGGKQEFRFAKFPLF